MDNKVWRRGSSREDGADWEPHSLICELEPEGQSSLTSPEQLEGHNQITPLLQLQPEHKLS